MVFTQDTTTTGSKVQEGSSNNNQDVYASKSEQQSSSKLPRGRKPRKSSKSPLKKNKPPRRGMGIAKLEIRRLQACGSGDHNLPADVAFGFPLHPHYHDQFQTPLTPVAASPSVYVGCDLLMSRSSSSSSYMAASSKVVGTLGGGACGKELSSIPKVMQCREYFDASSYFKNKCMDMDEMQGMILGGMNSQDKFVFPNSLLTGLNHAGHNSVGLEMKDLTSSDMRNMVYNQDSEMMGITRPHASSSCSTLKEYEFFPPGKGLKEYEFFPGTSSGRSYTRSSEQPNHYYITEPAAADASYFIPRRDFSQYNAANATNTNALDLSLKLSL